MLNRTAARRRPLARVSCAAGLLVLLGTATVLVVGVRVPVLSDPASAVSATHPDLSRADAGQLDAVPHPSAGSGGRGGALTDAGRRVPARATDIGRTLGADAALHRSLVWSGLLGLAISLTGLAIVGTRRRMW